MGISTKHSNQVMDIIVVIASVVLLSAITVNGRKDLPDSKGASTEYAALNCRAQSASILDFGGVGDGKASNTKAFQAAIQKLGAAQGGGQLVIPPGKFLTSPFTLTSHFTLYLQKDAVILAAPEEADWTVVDALPSYGKGKEPGFGRYNAFISGTNLTDVVITGDNGTIDGQGQFWYEKADKLKAKRPHLIELLYSKDIQLSNITLTNSPSYHFHPVYSSNVIVQGLTILANVSTANTDGLVPDSCVGTRIEDCYIVSGEDCIALKSGWDEYGLKTAMPTSQVVIRRVTCISPSSSLIAIGSEMSGGVADVRAEDLHAINTESGIRIKSAVGRGGYVRDIYARKISMETMKWAFFMTGDYGSHPDNNSSPTAIPVVENINLMDVTAKNVSTAGQMGGIKGHPFSRICLSNVNIEMAKAPPPPPAAWNCSDVAGTSSAVTPPLCPPLAAKGPPACKFPTEKLPIEDIKMQMCPVQVGGKAPAAQATTPSASPESSTPGKPSSAPSASTAKPSSAPSASSGGKASPEPTDAPSATPGKASAILGKTSAAPSATPGKASSDDASGKSSSDDAPGKASGKASSDDAPGKASGKASSDDTPGKASGKASSDDAPGKSPGKASSADAPGKASSDDAPGKASAAPSAIPGKATVDAALGKAAAALGKTAASPSATPGKASADAAPGKASAATPSAAPSTAPGKASAGPPPK